MIEVVVPLTTLSTSGGIATAIDSNVGYGNSVFPTTKSLTPFPASSTFPYPVLTSSPGSANSLTTPTTTNVPGLIPSSISVSGTTYMYVGCFEGQYIQSIVARYSVGSIFQCASLCVGSIYFTLEAGDQCKRPIMP